jgi:hypothetical protein
LYRGERWGVSAYIARDIAESDGGKTPEELAQKYYPDDHSLAPLRSKNHINGFNARMKRYLGDNNLVIKSENSNQINESTEIIFTINPKLDIHFSADRE